MTHIKITLPDGSVKDFPKGTTAAEIAKSIGKRLAEDAVAAKVNETLKDLDAPINEDANFQIITLNDKEGLDCLRHSLAHLLAAAVMELWPDTKRTIGPAIEDGFYFDFEFSKPITQEVLPKIEKKMRELLTTWKGFEKHELTAAEAKKEYKDNPYKIELIEEFSKGGKKVTFYKSGKYWDLCRGGHVEHPNTELKYFKLQKIAGAYWRGSEKNKMLTRIYGTAFPTQKELDDHLLMLEEAKKRDHKILGKELDLFIFSDLVGPGLPLWTPRGSVIR